MLLTWIRWLDACAKEAADSPDATPELAELQEVGFLLAETEHVVLIGMEAAAHDTHAGRWRLNIPKIAILERRDFTLAEAFRKPRKRKSRAKVKPIEKTADS